MSGEATATPKAHDGDVESLRMLKVLQRSANKARPQALNQLRAVMLTAPEELRQRLRQLKTRELLDTCRGFRVRLDDDSLAGTTRLVLRELAQRIAVLDEQLTDTTARLRRITSAVAPDLVAKHGVGPDTNGTVPTRTPATTSPDESPRARTRAKPSAASSATSLARCSPRYRKRPSFDSRSMT
jgi:hypothetical protein